MTGAKVLRYRPPMTNIEITWVGIIVSFIAVFALNMTYFSPNVMYNRWTRALGRPAPEPGAQPGTGMAPAFTLVTIGLFLQCFLMDWVIQATAALYGQDVSFLSGLFTGAVVGIGIAAAASLGHRVFSGQGVKVWAIEVGADVIGLALMGAIFSFWH